MEFGRKLIGVILSQADAPYQEKLIKGILSQAYELDYDIAVFSTFIKNGMTDEWQKGEANIYNLINYDLLDGIIIVPDTIQLDGAIDKIISDIKIKFNKPVVASDMEIKDIPTLFTDDLEPMKKLITHLIEDHGYSDIAFMTGRKNHPHSNSRLNGYYEALVEHNIQIDTSRVFYGDFWYNEGENVVETLCSCGRPMPQAIACANDQMAISICSALEKRGIRVPDDIAVTGYDTYDLGQKYYPEISSAPLPSYHTGRSVVQLLHSMITETKYINKPVETEILILESCGCSNIIDESRLRCAANTDIEFGNFYSRYNFMMESLISVTDLKSYMNVLSAYTEQLGEFSDFYLCLCDNWDNLGETEDTVNYLKNGYSKKMHMLLYCGNNESFKNSNKMFYSHEMLPDLKASRDNPKAFFFTPIHYNDRCFGYSVISYGDHITSYDETYRLWMRCVHSTLETLRRQRNLSYMYKCMVKNALTDALTGIYNRNGFNQYADEMIISAQQLGENLLLILGDLNNLKHINDKFSHLDGDFAIKTTAMAFKSSCILNEFCFRIGGDEFLIMSTGDYTTEQINDIIKRIDDELIIANRLYNKPYELSVSTGVFYGDASELEDIEQALSIADREMFKNKNISKNNIASEI